MIKRILQPQIEKRLFQGKIVIVYGPRQAGKTTLVKEILKKYKNEGRYINCDILSNVHSLETTEPEKLKFFLGEKKLIVLDEAQRVKNIGLTLKVLIDTYPKLQIIATGSSSFDLANEISEPLTGRAVEFMLYPLSFQEIEPDHKQLNFEGLLGKWLRFGSYPEVFGLNSEKSKETLDLITSSYLYKDVLAYEKIQKSSLISRLLQLLALQVGGEVSYRELGRTLGVASRTIDKYIDLLEKSFVIFRLGSFSRNLRKEIAKSFKIYFYDLGIRNSLIQAFNPLDIRQDVGSLWENFCISERLKYNAYNKRRVNSYFWRTYTQKEIDFIEESEGKLTGFEFKWSKNQAFKKPEEFLKTYANSSIKIINKTNFHSFLL